jgi:Raf kinase inhibitor-like YbhB/YbcL family protein
MRLDLVGKTARTAIGCAVVGAFLVLASCSDDETPAPAGSSGTSGGTVADSGGTAQDGSSSGNPIDSGTDTGTDTGSSGNPDSGPFALTSTAYTNGQMIPTKHECSSNGPGQNVSPPLAWTGAPAGTQSYAIVMRDLDYMNGFIHWVIWDIPANTTSLPENIDHVANPTTPAGAKQAAFNGSITGYHGPCSPGGVNTYEITVYALPTATVNGISTASDKTTAAAAIVGAATATARLAGES